MLFTSGKIPLAHGVENIKMDIADGGGLLALVNPPLYLFLEYRFYIASLRVWDIDIDHVKCLIFQCNDAPLAVNFIYTQPIVNGEGLFPGQGQSAGVALPLCRIPELKIIQGLERALCFNFLAAEKSGFAWARNFKKPLRLQEASPFTFQDMIFTSVQLPHLKFYKIISQMWKSVRAFNLPQPIPIGTTSPVLSKPRLLYHPALADQLCKGPLDRRAGEAEVIGHGANGVPALAVFVGPVMEVEQHLLGLGAQFWIAIDLIEIAHCAVFSFFGVR